MGDGTRRGLHLSRLNYGREKTKAENEHGRHGTRQYTTTFPINVKNSPRTEDCSSYLTRLECSAFGMEGVPSLGSGEKDGHGLRKDAEKEDGRKDERTKDNDLRMKNGWGL
jgi:hypothetical protein